MKALMLTLALLGVASCGAHCGVSAVRCIKYEQDCGGYLKRASDANTVELARRELARAVAYLDERGFTEGYTSVLWRTPDEDVGFWYTNLRASLAELDAVPEGASALERSNVLMKLRETLLDQGDKGARVTEPDGITRFPHNAAFMYLAVAWMALLLLALILFVVTYWDEF